ncbi:type II secretion system F family protein [Pollutimonas harenae]|uniref:Type II secretion system F family protein n=1 Tax=Pollutimonas harenae TaxID=657015 RepID=A0A853GUN7_9BURK|nr:type II secretion system F family protein [Pollutimonas harenae]NYT85857.1 type II secretion system F family protein [Pollutimonas harenae]TEA70914.1 type II secretion system F family protein [Pollutimonas harenae]
MFFWISCLAAGLSLYLLVWVFTRPLLQKKGQMHHMPGRLLLHLSWPWILALTPVCQPFVSWRMRRGLSQRLLTAGLGQWCLPEHIVAMQLFGLFTLTLVSALTLQASGVSRLTHIVLPCLLVGLVGMLWPRYWLRSLARQRQLQMLREFPFLLDMTTLCVEAGLNLHGALQQAAQHGPEGPLRGELRHALADMRAGVPRVQALQKLAQRCGVPAVQSLVTALAQADQLGMNLGPLLRSQSEQRRVERFLRAEKLALEAPVKMLFPMVFCIFPCTFLIIGFPIVIKLLAFDS